MIFRTVFANPNIAQLGPFSLHTERMTAPLKYCSYPDPMLLLNHSIWITNNEINYKPFNLGPYHFSVNSKKPCA